MTVRTPGGVRGAAAEKPLNPSEVTPLSPAAAPRPVTVAGGTGLTARDAMGAPGLQVDDHMSVDVALSVLIGARATHLLLQDGDGRCSGLVTRAQLTAQRAASSYGDRARLRDIPLDRGPFTASVSALGDAESAMRIRTLDVSPVVDEQGYALGVLTVIP